MDFHVGKQKITHTILFLQTLVRYEEEKHVKEGPDLWDTVLGENLLQTDVVITKHYHWERKTQ